MDPLAIGRQETTVLQSHPTDPGIDHEALRSGPLEWVRASLRWLKEPFSRGGDEPAHLATGKWGEEQAGQLLKRKGYRILGRRVRVGARGELDLVARTGETLVFVEVKTRACEDFGRPQASVDRAKRKRVCQAAVRYVMSCRPRPGFIRFDVVEVIGTAADGLADIRHIENAFSLDRRVRLPW
jgi:putative endonuclease